MILRFTCTLVLYSLKNGFLLPIASALLLLIIVEVWWIMELYAQPWGKGGLVHFLPTILPSPGLSATMCLKVAKRTSKAETTVDASYGNHFNQDSLNVITELEGKPTFKTMRKMLTAEYAIE